MAVVSGSPPYFKKDIATGAWAGAAVEMAKSIAAIWSAEVVYIELTFGNSVLDVQSNKIDIAFALNPTPQRALAIGFTRPLHRRAVRLPRENRASTRRPGAI